ncbi:sensor histidine kinase [Actinotalea subterranea]|uniref:sensor histidine kinase n=1 Tax=Actinotalea subterranea TaxID=2607497 RepID=UPI0011ED41FB|nr:histidine kinase [Actinotalea subterranea]
MTAHRLRTPPPGAPAPGPVPAGHPDGAPEFTELTARRLGPVRRFFVRHPVAMDVVVMLWFAVPSLLALLATATQGPFSWDGTRPQLVAAGFIVLGTVLLFWRRRRPLLVITVMTVLTAACTGLSGSTNGFDLGVCLALYAVAASRPALTTWLSFTGSMGVTGLVLWSWEAPDGVPASDVAGVSVTDDNGAVAFSSQDRLLTIAFVMILGLLAVAIGTSVRNRRLHIADLVERANSLARDRDREALLARAAERARIAREMHDVVAHSLSVMIALGDGASAAIERSPDRSRAALDELSATGRAALTDMRRVLGVLDAGPEPDADAAPLEPQPSAPDLVALVERFRAAGLPVRTDGLTTALPGDAGLQLAVYRIVQESLTNVLRHAPGTSGVDLTLRRTPDGVEVDVVDEGPALPGTTPPSDGAGRGLIGIGERAGVYAGTVDAGPWHTGWRVRTVIPWQERA